MEILQPIKTKFKLPALAGALVSSDGILLTDVVGNRKNGVDIPITAQDQWPLSGSTKALTATLLAIIVEQGKLTFQTTIADIFPELLTNVDPFFGKINLWHLLSHHSGLPRDIDWRNLASGAPREQRQEAIKVAARLKLDFQPGTMIVHSNLGYVIAGAIAENVMQKSYETLISELIFQPLDMASAGFGAFSEPSSIDHPWGHKKDGTPDYWEIPPVLNPAGGAHCALTDWCKFIADLMRGARGQQALLKTDSYQRLLTPPFSRCIALGWIGDERDWGRGPVFFNIGHNGLTVVSTSIATTRDLAMVVFMNQDAMYLPEAAQEAGMALLKSRFPDEEFSQRVGPLKLKSHDELINSLDRRGLLALPSIAAAFRAFPRELFLPGVPAEQAYIENAVVTKWDKERSISSSSQPSLMALMLMQLNLKPGYRVLEIGSGTGYNAALMAHIVGDSGQVTTLDIDEDIIQQAEANIAKTGLKNVRLICADGVAGYFENAPYDRIVLTTSSPDIAPAWLEQLKPDGQLLMPLLIEQGILQRAVLFRRMNGHLESATMILCAFMSLRGAYDSHINPILLGDKHEIKLFVKDELHASLDSQQIYRLLSGSYTDLPTSIHISEMELNLRLLVWLGLKIGPALSAERLQLEFTGEAAGKDFLPYLAGMPGKSVWTIGFYRDGNLILLTRQQGKKSNSGTGSGSNTFELLVRSYNTNNRFAEELVKEIILWNSQRRPPMIETMKICAYSKSTDIAPSECSLVAKAKESLFTISWNKEWFI